MGDISLAVAPGTRGQVRLSVTRTLVGSELGVVVHVVRGTTEGPTLGVLATVHGDEAGVLPIMKRFLELIEPSRLRGTILAVPVANPLALANFARTSPEQHTNTDLHSAFPGTPNGTLTQMIAHQLTVHMLDSVDALVDMHSGGTGGRLQRRVDFDYRLEGETRHKTLALCKAVGFDLVHQNQLEMTASWYVNRRGVPTANLEIGGAYLGPVASGGFEQSGVDALLRVAHSLGMIDAAPAAHVRQLLFDRASRIEVNPKVGGFLESNLDSPENLGTRIEQGTVLGRVIDPHTLAPAEKLVAPHTGYLFFSRYSGIVEGGAKVFGIAREDTSEWL